ncbi:MAG TPA: hypothetical protein P5294_05345 [Smithellaceae bacterium]|nr:hypothetical protein [Smithellaceae bacterium]HRS88658.1 hypothetical protein [Smithellaceae bacterium]HRV25938.1 hypothetical protein [Smithellaceae bacterium]
METKERHSEFGENHQRVIGIHFKRINRLLSEIEFLINDAKNPSPFSEYIMDLAPEKIDLLHDQLKIIRKKMNALLANKGIAFHVTSISLLNAINTRLIFADISAEETRAKYMRGYGKLSDKAAEDLEEIASAIQQMINELKAALNQ